MDSSNKEPVVESEKRNENRFVVPIEISSSSSSSSSSSGDSSDMDDFDDSFIDSMKDLDAKFIESIKRRSRNKLCRKRMRSPNGVESRGLMKIPKQEEEEDVVLPRDFLILLPPLRGVMPLRQVLPKLEDVTESESLPETVVHNTEKTQVLRGCKQFWKAGDYEDGIGRSSDSSSVGMDHVRVHPKFLHSNATSHKWALGAFAELLDNSLDEICNGATHIHVDMLQNEKDGTKMLLVQDDGGGMTPDKLRKCMSLGYSVKSKLQNTIGQYGNGFKTSTMRLGADVIVFSRCPGCASISSTQSIGMLSYTFLKSTGKEDVVVPMVDYEHKGRSWNKLTRSSPDDWNRNLEIIMQWAPFLSEEDLQLQFRFLNDRGTRIIIYNLWEDDEGNLELDFDTDPHDIQIRGANRDEKNIQMAKQYPNSRHFLTYRHSLRSYVSILYLRLPPHFRIILRGKDVEHHNIVKDMMLIQETTYKPQIFDGRTQKLLNVVAPVTLGFVKDAHHHIDIQGFNVYHKNRLIKPFWRVWNAAGSGGRGVIGVIEADFVEPAHDKQGFEHTTVLARLEARLQVIQKKYWQNNSGSVGYSDKRVKKKPVPTDEETSVFSEDKSSSQSNQNANGSPREVSKVQSSMKKLSSHAENTSEDKSIHKATLAIIRSQRHHEDKSIHTATSTIIESQRHHEDKSIHKATLTIIESHRHHEGKSIHKATPTIIESQRHHEDKSIHKATPTIIESQRHHGDKSIHKATPTIIESQQHHAIDGRNNQLDGRSHLKAATSNQDEHASSTHDQENLAKLKEENKELKKRLQELSGLKVVDLQNQLHDERDRCKSLEIQLQEAIKKKQELDQEHETLVDLLVEERNLRDQEEEKLRKSLKDASKTIDVLLEKVRQLEEKKILTCKVESKA